MSKNHVYLEGNLARDPEQRYTPKGIAVCQFTVATSNQWEKDGEKKEATDYVPCQAWGGWAEKVAGYAKGQPVFVTGRVITQSWEDKTTGKMRYKTLVQANSITTIASPRREAAKPKQPDALPTDGDDDVTF